VTVTVPREALTARLGDSSVFCARPISTGSPVAGLASEFISLLQGRLGTLNEAASNRLAEQALDLIALAFTAELGQARPALSSSRATTLLRLKAVIEARLSDPALKPEAVAAEAGFSVRYANELLREENFSLERYIVHRRLERCRRALEDPLQSHRMISEIAFSWGFSDHSHFTRRFRAEFGMAPGDWRRARQETGCGGGSSGN
jgi:AraC-like DNA-binding protein